MAQIIDGKAISLQIKDEVKEETNADINVLEYINTIEYDYETLRKHLRQVGLRTVPQTRINSIQESEGLRISKVWNTKLLFRI